MRKSDKKMDNQIRLVLTDVCETALKDIQGFEWLTHTVDYARFPQTLKVTCVFDTNENLEAYLHSTLNHSLALRIHTELKSLDIKIKNIQNHISYDTEEHCHHSHEGNWAERLH
ncbi:Fis family transcriptional regulator [Marinomonas mediterranea]|uniref:Fis family transcriptional regulator n=1 Tax=Marinomonas mediterranea (strain ATCC 700492 / JCM 21426 / NBRC 103028 / MMB-1) TaxID=717774 RepID=F2JTM5_MARM1|nr:hypothetical protein [Marinomonas mediterranea]ADZ92645.1 hypothetical protein Marme_3429 [Marinomonas mediterranea MMB-1]WCN14634.1 Fis family transcriptional regulator [Marinomonas mediterranea]WCN18681.1 Fis family transcriptional regulator [Marinomonas mediterranea MMB-1]